MVVITREVDQWVQIGESIFVAPTDVDARGARLLAKGRMLGGAEDGATFSKAADLGIGGEMRIGPHVVVTVVDTRGNAVRLGVQAPRHVEVQRKEIARKDGLG